MENLTFKAVKRYGGDSRLKKAHRISDRTFIDHFEKDNKFINYMKSNQFINQEIYENMQANTGKPKCSL